MCDNGSSFVGGNTCNTKVNIVNGHMVNFIDQLTDHELLT